MDKERRAIISFISKHRCHNYVKGREMWQKAEAAKVCVLVVSCSTLYLPESKVVTNCSSVITVAGWLVTAALSGTVKHLPLQH